MVKLLKERREESAQIKTAMGGRLVGACEEPPSEKSTAADGSAESRVKRREVKNDGVIINS